MNNPGFKQLNNVLILILMEDTLWDVMKKIQLSSIRES